MITEMEGVAPSLRTSAELAELFAALSAAQGEMTDPGKARKALVPMKSGGSYSYKYSDLSDLLKIIRPVFAKHGLSIVQFPMNPQRGSVTIITRIGHKSGQWIEGDLTLAVADDRPQTLGSAITYGRRYAAGCAAGISPDEDEDGQVAQSAARESPEQHMTEHEDGYDPQDRGHQDWLMKQLKAKKVPEGRWDEVGNALKGKAASEFPRVLAQVMSHGNG